MKSTHISLLDGKVITSKFGLKMSKYFENFIIALIILSSITLCIDTPLLNPDSFLATFLRYLDYLFTFLFTVEMLMKIIALGFFFN